MQSTARMRRRHDENLVHSAGLQYDGRLGENPFIYIYIYIFLSDLRLKQQIRQRTYVVINISIYEKVHGLMSPL